MEFKQNLGPFLVIVPLSTLSNWQNEFAKWCPAARTITYKGTPVQRRDLYKDHIKAGNFNVLLTTYEFIIRDKKLLRRHTWQYAIVDEGCVSHCFVLLFVLLRPAATYLTFCVFPSVIA